MKTVGYDKASLIAPVSGGGVGLHGPFIQQRVTKASKNWQTSRWIQVMLVIKLHKQTKNVHVKSFYGFY